MANIAAAQVRVTGMVTYAEDGTPVAYAAVTIKGVSGIGVYTEADGKYSLDNVASNATLVFSYIGYSTQEVAVNGRSVINVALSPDAALLDEVMVVAYGTTTRGSYSGSASVVRNDKIKDLPVPSFIQALSGNVAGMQVSQTSGMPGAMPEIQIRGISSFNAGTAPLYVIDGIPMISGDYSTSNMYTSAMNYLNGGDVESVTVLKDAAAASLYGSRAANGVILITTKKGTSGKAVSNFKASVGFSYFAMKNFQMTTEAESEMLIREALTNYGTDNPSVITSNGYTDLNAYVNGQTQRYFPARDPSLQYVNWEDALFRTGVTQNYEYSISGGGQNSRVYASVAYANMEGINVMEYMTRVNATINAEQKVLNDKVTMSAGFQFGVTDQSGHQEDDVWDNPYAAFVQRLTPRWPFKNADGSYWMQSYDGTAYRNPINNFDKQITESKQYKTMIKGSINWEILKELNLKTTLSYDNLRVDDRFGWMVGHMNGEAYGMGYMGDKYARIEKLVSSTTLNFNKSFGDHNISALAGWEAERTDHKYTHLSMTDFANYNLISTELAATLVSGGTSEDQDALLSFLSSLNYDYKSKYYLTGTFRSDGSSRFGLATRWGNFYSVSGSWRVSNENFMQGIKWIDDLRLRASYGTNGIVPGSLYGHMALYSYDSYGTDGAAFPYNVANSNLSWERNENLNIAIDLTLFNKLNITADWYERTTKDLLLDAQIPSTTGFTTSLMNVGSMLNRGIELSANIDVLKKGDITWNVGANWSTVHNEILELSGEKSLAPSRPFIRQVGYSFYQYYSREYLGANAQTGAAEYISNRVQADGTLDKSIATRSNAASTLLEGKTALPKGFGGFNTTFTWKDLSVNLNFNFKYGHWVWDDTTDDIQTDGQYPYKNMSRKQLDRWTTPGQVTEVPRRTLTPNGGYYDSDRFLVKGDFLRLKGATISYNIPKAWTDKINFRNAKVYVSGTNLLTFTGMEFDPEIRMSGYYDFGIPPLRTISFGLEVSF